jgi:hypothetical protein
MADATDSSIMASMGPHFLIKALESFAAIPVAH